MSTVPLFGTSSSPRRARRSRRKPLPGLVIDLYAGGGGASKGIHAALGKSPDYAINHSAPAIRMHWENHPDTIHYQTDLDQTEPLAVTRGQPVYLLWASPGCPDHSRAAGGKPKNPQRREQGWNVVRWARDVRPLVICCENVAEWQKWSPLHPADHPNPKLRNMPIKEREGETWRAWLQALRDLGYVVEYRMMAACKWGAPTTRDRLFVVARRDGLPIVWPAPTHGPADSAEVKAGLLLPYRTAAECIDWSIPMCSIFATPAEAKAWAREHGTAGIPKRPLAGPTQDRVREGAHRFILSSRRPFVVNLAAGATAPVITKAHSNGFDRPGSGVWSAGDPLATLTTTEQYAVAAAHLLNVSHGGRSSAVDEPITTLAATPKGGDRHLIAAGLIETGNGEREGQAPRVRDLERPMGTITAQGSQGAVAAAWVVRNNGTDSIVTGTDPRDPMPTVTGAGNMGVAAAFLDKTYSSARAGQSIEEPAPTTLAGGSHTGLVTAAVAPTEAPVTVRLTPAARERARKVLGFLTVYYSGGGTSAALDDPMPTVVTKARHGLVLVTVVSSDGTTVEPLATVTIDGTLWVIVDIAMRMLTPRELARAQGFPDSYILTGTKSEQIERIGNSVSPQPAEALIRANLPVEDDTAMAAK